MNDLRSQRMLPLCPADLLRCCLAALVLLHATPAWAQNLDLGDLPLTFVGQATSTGATFSGGGRLQITVQRWSSEDEAARMRGAFAELGQSGVVAALDASEQVGFIRQGTGVGTPLQYAVRGQTEDGWIVLIATTRPVSALESHFNLRTMEYPLMLIELKLDADGNGEGAIAAGAQLVRDDRTGRLRVQRWDTQPIKLAHVKVR